jgi:hypothetical protein
MHGYVSTPHTLEHCQHDHVGQYTVALGAREQIMTLLIVQQYVPFLFKIVDYGQCLRRMLIPKNRAPSVYRNFLILTCSVFRDGHTWVKDLILGLGGRDLLFDNGGSDTSCYRRAAYLS